MKKLPIILNVIILIAVAVLYVLHFSCNKSCSTKASADIDTLASSPMPTGNIVYINTDSVSQNYDMYKDIFKELQDKLSTSEAQLQTRQRAFEKKVKDLQYKAERQLETRAKLAQMEQSLGKEQQDLMALQNKLRYELAEEEQVMQRKILNSIMEYLKQIENENSYQFVLGNSFGGNIFYANDNLDVTKQVIEGLNAEYAKSKAATK